MDNTMTIKKGDKEVKCTIIFTYYSEEFKKNYVVFQPEDEDVISQCVRKVEAEALNTAMDHLPEEYQLVLQLKYVEEMPVKEIAEATGRTVHSINSLLKRARSALRNELLKEGFRYEKS